MCGPSRPQRSPNKSGIRWGWGRFDFQSTLAVSIPDNGEERSGAGTPVTEPRMATTRGSLKQEFMVRTSVQARM